MAEPFLAEVRLFSFAFPPRGWAQCNGQLIPINQNQALFALLGTTYGGDGRVTFALPNLQGRAPVFGGQSGPIQNIQLGQTGGEELHTLTVQEMAQHNHACKANAGNVNVATPVNNTWGKQATPAYGTTGTGSMKQAAIANAGGTQAHINLEPYLVINFCIALQGIFPSQN